MAASFIPYGRQCIDEADEQAVLEALRSDYITQGQRLEEFEEALALYVGARFCVAVSSATAALHLATLAMNLQTGTGITSPNTFVASSNVMIYGGLVPKFADIDEMTYNLSPVAVQKAITSETRLIMPVHFAGVPADMLHLQELVEGSEIKIIEDASHAIGSEYPNGGGRVGNCAYSDMTIFSFHAVKTITAAEGGAITTNDAGLFEKLRLLRSHGITRDTKLMARVPGLWYYEMQELGFNYRMTELQAALGHSQLRKLESFASRRANIIECYRRELSELSWLSLPLHFPDQKICYHLFVLKINFKAIARTRSEVMEQLASAGIGTQVHYIPVHLQPYYQKQFGSKAGDCPVAESYYENCLSIPLHQGMSDDDVDRVIAAIRALA